MAKAFGPGAPQGFTLVPLSGAVQHGVILLYHRIADPAVDPFLMNVHPDHFRQQMEVLRDRFTLVPLEEFVGPQPTSAGLQHRVAVTFDDGYADNLSVAQPILETCGVPATVFVTTGNPGRPFWWDELEWSLLSVETLPERLAIRIGGRSHEWHVKDLGFRRRRWLPMRVAIPGPKAEATGLLRRLHSLIRAVDPTERADVLAALAEWSGCAGTSPHRALEEPEIRLLAAAPQIELGAHTVSHPRLSEVTVERQEEEIDHSRRAIEAIIGRQVRTFSYPFGQKGDFTRQSVGLVRKLGFSLACTAWGRRALGGADPFRLPRFWVEDWNGAMFESRLTAWLGLR